MAGQRDNPDCAQRQEIRDMNTFAKITSLLPLGLSIAGVGCLAAPMEEIVAEDEDMVVAGDMVVGGDVEQTAEVAQAHEGHDHSGGGNAQPYNYGSMPWINAGYNPYPGHAGYTPPYDNDHGGFPHGHGYPAYGGYYPPSGGYYGGYQPPSGGYHPPSGGCYGGYRPPSGCGYYPPSGGYYPPPSGGYYPPSGGCQPPPPPPGGGCGH